MMASDTPVSALFQPTPFKGTTSFRRLQSASVSRILKQSVTMAPRGTCSAWGIPFEIKRPLLVKDTPVTVDMDQLRTQWLVFMHTTDLARVDWNQHGFIDASPGAGRLGEHVANYVITYSDGSEVSEQIRRRHQIGMLQRGWGENCFQAVPMQKPNPMRPPHEQLYESQKRAGSIGWGFMQTRAQTRDDGGWCNWLWAWENPHPRKAIASLRLEPVRGAIIISAIANGQASSLPLRWESRRKAVLRLPKRVTFDPALDEDGLLTQIRLDMGQVISAQPRFEYPNDRWHKGYNNEPPKVSSREVLVEYSAHPDASFHLSGGISVPVRKLSSPRGGGGLKAVSSASRRIKLRVIDRKTRQPVAAKLHAHGELGEYLAPCDRHRIPNPAWFEDYSSDYIHVDYLSGSLHYCTYIPGETSIDLPVGKVYLEVSKGFDVTPVRKVIDVAAATRTVTITVDRALGWRERGWVTADTHVHFLSPPTAQLEGAAEGVNVINLLASQWGELMTNVGDFDGKSTYGSRQSGGDGEYLVRVGTENRQHVMGHISLLGYSGDIISPMCTCGPDESALGDPVATLMTEWARRCRDQGGLVVFPHFPNPRAEHAATLIHGDVDAVEMTSWGDLYSGINPYSLSDWYRYLNCGYFYPAVGGTDKMSAGTAVGTIRTYARIPDNDEFTYQGWMDAVRGGHTFVTYGPLMEFRVDGKVPGSWINMGSTGGSVEVEYEVASTTMPMSRVELIVNGEIRESRTVSRKQLKGSWSIKLARSSWLALLVRGCQEGRTEMIAAHSSPVMVRMTGSPFFAAADAVTILDQIEGSLAYLDTVATRADATAYKRMRLILTSAHRKLHNEMHRNAQ